MKESYEARLLDRFDSLGAFDNTYTRYAAVSFSVFTSSLGSKQRLVDFSAKMSKDGRVHKGIIMFRCWFLHLPLRLLWQPHYTIRAFFPFPLLGLVCFISASKNGRVCYNLCGGFC